MTRCTSPRLAAPRLAALLACTVSLLLVAQAGSAADASLTPKQQVGLMIFRDKNLSQPAGQACASCHDAGVAFSDSIAHSPTSRGVDHSLFGPRNAPALNYAAFSPNFQAGDENGGYFGGQFRDGRANTLEEQVRGPLLNPIEMANTSSQAVIDKLKVAAYAPLFQSVYGANVFDDTATAFTALADALATFERSHRFSPFSSKYDQWQKGSASLSDAEQRGMLVFNAADKGNCASCHNSVSAKPSGLKPLFTDFGYDNIGVPRNPANRFYGAPAQYNPDGQQYVDIGLGAVVLRGFTRGQFKAPTLRNIAVTGPYMHNGYFKTLRGLVDFYNTRDVKPTCPDPFTTEAKALRQGCWPVAEVVETVNKTDMGNLGLSEQDVDDLVTFLGTLTDGWTPPTARR